jgi:M6 family metalloprotease-like protein
MKRPGLLSIPILFGSLLLSPVLSLTISISQTINEGADNATPEQLAKAMTSQLTEQVYLRILLVEFTDVRCRKDTDGVTPKYSCRDFETLLGSTGIYVSPAMRSPDGDEVFGSMNDYFRQMSNGLLNIRAVVINKQDSITGKPVWVRLPKTKQYYQKICLEIFDHAKRAAKDAGIDASPSIDVKLAIIYAGNLYFACTGLAPQSVVNRYLMSELQGKPYDQEHAGAKFSQIGHHCHEFGHTIGIGHSSGSRADLMEAGGRNGSVAGNAPAPLNPIARMKKGWITPIQTSETSPQDLTLHYSLVEPMVVKMANRDGSYFLVENRRFDQAMTIGATNVPDYNNTAFFPPAWPHGRITQGIFVWRVLPIGYPPDIGYSSEGLLYASGRYGRTYPENCPSETDDGVPFPGVSGKRILSPWSDPRNPDDVEGDYFGSIKNHFTLYVPNTKSGSSCGMEILSEDRAQGLFRVRFYASDPPNPEIASLPSTETLSSYANRRTLCSDGSGGTLRALEAGGEIFVRRESNDKREPKPMMVSDGTGGQSSPCLSMAGSSVLAVWQRTIPWDRGYQVVSSHSGDAGGTWSAPEILTWKYGTSSPPPLPQVAESKTGSAMILYRSGSTLQYLTTTNGGTTWSESAPGPSDVADWPAATLSITETSDGAAEAILAYCSDRAQSPARVCCVRYSFESATWGPPQCVSGNLPVQFPHHRNPNIVSMQTNTGKIPTIVWDATDSHSHGTPVIVVLDARLSPTGKAYRLLRGVCQNDISVLDLGERLTEARSVGSGLVMNATDSPHGASEIPRDDTMRTSQSSGEDDAPTDVQQVPSDAPLPEAFELFQNYPNPCNPATVIRYRISATVDVSLIVYDILGREVAVLVCGKMAPGTYETRFNSAGLASGAYILRMTAGNFVQTKKMAVVG